MMSQTHIGYTYWQQPENNSMPEVNEIELSATAEMGVAIEGSANWWPVYEGEAILPEIDPYNKQRSYIEIFNRGEIFFRYSIQPGESWIKLSQLDGEIKSEQRVWISVDWENAPKGSHKVPIIISGPDENSVVIMTPINNPAITKSDLHDRFIESNGFVSIEAEHFTREVNSNLITWQCIPNLGRTLSAVTAFPVTMSSVIPAGDTPHLEYQLYLFSNGEVKVKAFLSPTLNFHNNQGLRYGISLDNETPQIINMHEGKNFPDWEESVRNNITIEISTHIIDEPGNHTLKFWVIDPGVVLQKLVLETDQVAPSYLGPPESVYIKLNRN
jgi:hypothetical protein